jgi:2-hydroxychromene-2-carboxylate isomerase
MRTLTFYYDVVCPYAYLGSTLAPRLAEAAGVRLVWRPILLGGLFRHLEAPQEPARAMPPAKARLNALDMLRQADLLGVEASWHPRHPVRSVEAMRLLLGAPEAARPALTRALYRTYWVEHGDIAHEPTLDALARAHGVDPSVRRDPSVKARLHETTAEAAELGGFGVPIWRLTDEDGTDRFWWGADRAPLVARHLGVAWPAPAPRPRSPSPRPITFFHDFASPFSYLASTQVERLARDEGTTVSWVPFLLGALFREIGTPIVPMMAMNANKARYYARDMQDWARHWEVPFRMPSHFPLRTVAPLRVALQAPEATHHLYRAAWAEDRDIGDPDVLRQVLDEAGLDGAGLVEGTRDPAVKARLVANTERARAAGVCGVPSFVVGDQLFWGQDRLEMVRQAVRGWDGPTLA